MTRHAPALLVLSAALLAPAAAQDAPPPPEDTPADAPAGEAAALDAIVVGCATIRPFVMEEGDDVVGFEVELWDAIADEVGVEYTLREPQPFDSLLDDVGSGEVDVALGGITINDEREERLDFSHQYIPSGLQVLVPAREAAVTGVFGNVLANVFSPDFLPILLGGFVFVLLMALLCWWSEIGESGFDDRFYPGFLQAIYWALVTMSTVGYGDFAPKRPLGRVTTVLIIFVGISLYGTLVAKGASALTVESLDTEISSPEDLAQRKVATVEDSTSVPAIRSFGGDVVEVEDFDAAVEKLLAGEVAAVVFDSPTLHHHAQGEGSGEVMVVGRVFDRQYYGFALAPGSGLREPVNRAILKLRRNGVYEKLHAQYFGKG